jgi:hypothetical protein
MFLEKLKLDTVEMKLALCKQNGLLHFSRMEDIYIQNNSLAIDLSKEEEEDLDEH